MLAPAARTRQAATTAAIAGQGTTTRGTAAPAFCASPARIPSSAGTATTRPSTAPIPVTSAASAAAASAAAASAAAAMARPPATDTAPVIHHADDHRRVLAVLAYLRAAV
ncbi:hypothetical protein OHB01_01385 [Microbispora hainanensis]|uniref:hypothetical protein n=1 Tax=Microbispora hainanensis TaxID=568844 RepID=UPI002E2A7C86|nr:hypothetical protein [Microbispora hainanensis]